jgi:hypothetical protein
LEFSLKYTSPQSAIFYPKVIIISLLTTPYGLLQKNEPLHGPADHLLTFLYFARHLTVYAEKIKKGTGIGIPFQGPAWQD